jgi:hypothetical protein
VITQFRALWRRLFYSDQLDQDLDEKLQALGSSRGRVVGMVLRGAMLQAAVGLVFGIPVALVCALHKICAVAAV